MLTTLDGVRVLDFGIYFAGPYSPRLLGDLGADVVKLEPLDGDLLRPTTRPFNAAARGKRSIAVDLKRTEGREVAWRLAQRADVVTHNMRPGVAERLGMDYQTIRSLNPQVIYAYAPGWGSTGPDAGLPGFAPLFAGYCGLHYEAAGEGNDPVAPVGNEDNGNGLVGAMAVLMALYHRRRTGQGQYLENPQLNATLLMGMHMMRRDDGSVVGTRGLDGDRLGIHPLDRLYRTGDGWLAVSARRDDEFRRLVALEGFEKVAGSRDFADEEGRTKHGLALQDALGSVFATAKTVDWSKRLADAGVACEIPAGRDARQQFFDDPEQERLGRVECYQHPRWGEVKDVAVMIRLSAAGTRPGRPAPEVGQHSREILAEVGYADADIDELMRDGVVR